MEMLHHKTTAITTQTVLMGVHCPIARSVRIAGWATSLLSSDEAQRILVVRFSDLFLFFF